MKFITFALYFFTCQVTYDIIRTLISNYFLNKKFEKIRKQLEDNKGNVTWN